MAVCLTMKKKKIFYWRKIFNVANRRIHADARQRRTLFEEGIMLNRNQPQMFEKIVKINIQGNFTSLCAILNKALALKKNSR